MGYPNLTPLFYLLAAAYVIANHQSTTTQEPDPVVEMPVTPEAVWNPPAETWKLLQQQCGNRHNRGCLIAFMQQHDATERAIAIALRFGGEFFVSDFKHLGRVNLATVVSPFDANANEAPILVNGIPDLIGVTSSVDVLNVQQDSAFTAIKKAFPNALIDPSSPTFEQMTRLRGKGQRFVFRFPIEDGCRACGLVANVRIAFDFDSGGNYLGPKLLEIARPARKKAECMNGAADRLVASLASSK